jgi:hypothetical protein
VPVLGEALLTIACPDHVLSIFQCSWPIKAMAEGFAHDGSRGGMMPTLSLVDLSEELDPFSWLYVALEHPTYDVFVHWWLMIV